MPGRDGTGPYWGGGPRNGKNKCRNRGNRRNLSIGIGQGIVQSKLFRYQTPYDVQLPPANGPQQPISKNQELDILKQQAQILRRQMDSIDSRIDQLGKRKTEISENKLYKRAFVHEKKCTGCGICENTCKQRAITVDIIAKINLEKCKGCGICANTCPNEAISLRLTNNQYST